MKARTIRRRRPAPVPPQDRAENRAMARRAQEKDWRLTDLHERRIPRRLRGDEPQERDE